MMTLPAKAWPPIWLISATLLAGDKEWGGWLEVGMVERWCWNSERRSGPRMPQRRSRVPWPHMRIMGWRRGEGGGEVVGWVGGGFCGVGEAWGGDGSGFWVERRKSCTNARCPSGVLRIWGMY